MILSVQIRRSDVERRQGLCAIGMGMQEALGRLLEAIGAKRWQIRKTRRAHGRQQIYPDFGGTACCASRRWLARRVGARTIESTYPDA